MLLRITSKHFVAGIDTQRLRYAPIVSYMRDWSYEKIRQYCIRRGWKLEELDSENLFGEQSLPDAYFQSVSAPAHAKGYAAPPGTGPDGETCRTCKHPEAHRHSRRYWKCGLMKRFWTHGAATDIRLKSPACKYWEKRDEKTKTHHARPNRKNN